MDPSPKGKTGDTISTQEQMKSTCHDSVDLHQVLNYNFPFPPHEHIMYSSLAEAGIFDEFNEGASSLRKIDQLETEKTTTATKEPAELETQIMTSDAEKENELVCGDKLEKSVETDLDQPNVQTKEGQIAKDPTAERQTEINHPTEKN